MTPIALGRTGITVSRLCLGTGTTTVNSESAQSLLAVERFGQVLLHAHARGITFWDTSDNYGTHAHVAWALRQLPREAVQLTSKTYAVTADEARRSVEQSLAELGTSYLDVLLMHEPDSPEELAERAGALAGLHACKREGLVRAVGLSTHAILTLEEAAGREAQAAALALDTETAADAAVKVLAATPAAATKATPTIAERASSEAEMGGAINAAADKDRSFDAAWGRVKARLK
jgi:aryl-alcohol dehydrogenase-like predicted oxidoreductase